MASGKCGKNLRWTLSGGRLVISGTGAMDDYDERDYESLPPWWDDDDYVVCCEAVKKIIISDGVTTIGEDAFVSCINLKEIRLPDSVTEIGRNAFSRCESLKEIKIPDSVTSIGDWAFSSCINLKEIRLPDSVTEIGRNAFSRCESLKEIKIPDSVTFIGEYAFSHCSRLTNVLIFDGVTEIGEWAFNDCSRLTNVSIPDSVTEIGEWAFNKCFNLKEIRLPDGVTTIGEGAFSLCGTLKEITIPDSVIDIGQQVFDGCTNLKKIYCKRGTGFEGKLRDGNNAEIIYYDAMPPAPVVEKLRWKVEGINLTVGGVNKIKDYSKEVPPWNDYLRDVQRIIVEDGVTEIAAHAFSNCVALEHVTIPASLETIGDFAFTFCYCGEWNVNNRKNVIWSLDNGTLMIKKNPIAANETDFSIGDIAWKDIEKNIKAVRIERGIFPAKNFFDWINRMGDGVTVTF